MGEGGGVPLNPGVIPVKNKHRETVGFMWQEEPTVIEDGFSPDLRWDADKNGVLDDIYFSSDSEKRLFEDCFIKNIETAECRKWLRREAVNTDFYSYIDYIQFYIKDDEPEFELREPQSPHACTIESTTSWQPGIEMLDVALERLFLRARFVEPEAYGNLLAPAFEFIAGGMKGAAGRGLIFDFLSVLNEAKVPESREITMSQEEVAEMEERHAANKARAELINRRLYVSELPPDDYSKDQKSDMRNRMEGTDLDNEQLEVVAKIIWNHRKQIIKRLGRSLFANIFDAADNMLAGLEVLLEKVRGEYCDTGYFDGLTCSFQRDNLSKPKSGMSLTRDELVDVHRNFGQFMNCDFYLGSCESSCPQVAQHMNLK